MARKRRAGENNSKFLRRFGILSAVLAMLTSAALIGLLVLDMIGINELVEENGPRYYTVQFKTENRIIYTYTYKRGQKIDIPADPEHSEDEYYAFDFRGWDMTGDNVPDAIPTHAYFHFAAHAVYQRRQIKPFPSSSSEEVEESSEPVGESNG